MVSDLKLGNVVNQKTPKIQGEKNVPGIFYSVQMSKTKAMDILRPLRKVLEPVEENGVMIKFTTNQMNLIMTQSVKGVLGALQKP